MLSQPEDLTQEERQRIFDEIQGQARLAATLPAIVSGGASCAAYLIWVGFRFSPGELAIGGVICFIAIILTWKVMYERRIDKGLVEAGLEKPEILNRDE